MTEQERMALHQVKGMLKAYLTINGITCHVAEEAMPRAPSDHSMGFTTGQLVATTKAMRQHQDVLHAINAILEEDTNG